MLLSLAQTTEPTEYPPISTVYDELRAYCLTRLPPAHCDGILPQRYLYYPPELKPQTPTWAWVLLGFVIARVFYHGK